MDVLAAGPSRSWQADVAKLLSLPKGYRYGRKTLWEVHAERRGQLLGLLAFSGALYFSFRKPLHFILELGSCRR